MMSADSPCFARYMTGFAAVGEADCKMPRWVDYIAGQHPHCAVDVIVEATDSDYILIAMLHYERQCMHVVMDGAGLGRVSMRRMRCSGTDTPVSAADKKKKAALLLLQAGGGGGGGANSTGMNAATNKKPRQMEYVHIPLLCEVMSRVMQEMFDGGTAMRCLTAIVAFGGTDFCRNLPRLGPRRVWEFLPQVRCQSLSFSLSISLSISLSLSISISLSFSLSLSLLTISVIGGGGRAGGAAVGCQARLVQAHHWDGGSSCGGDGADVGSSQHGLCVRQGDCAHVRPPVREPRPGVGRQDVRWAVPGHQVASVQALRRSQEGIPDCVYHADHRAQRVLEPAVLDVLRRWKHAFGPVTNTEGVWLRDG